MTQTELLPLYVTNPYQALQSLMPFRVQDILLVSSLYDSFTLREDGRLNELIASEFLDLSLYHTPGLTHVATATAALALAKEERRFDLIITAPNPGDMDATDLARRVHEAGLDVPVVVLAYDNAERKDFEARHTDLSDIERIFLWQGNARILVAIVKYVEDRRNVAHDTGIAGVPVILVVEDNVRYYSSFLPTIYTELIGQSQRLITEGMNLSHKLVRMRGRPKILLATTFEEAWDLFTRYQPFILGLISDVEFPRAGTPSREAGFDLARMARAAVPDLAILLQSSRAEFAAGAEAVGAAFLRKYSDTLLTDLRRFMVEQFSLGDFVFRLPGGRAVGRAGDLKTLEALLRTVPAESIAYHGERNHFSNWLIARTEFALAHKLRPRKVSDFASLEDLREILIASIAEYRREQGEVLVADFDRETFDGSGNFFARIGGGSLGQARGLAFSRYLLSYHRMGRRFAGVRVGVPPAVVLATDCFDQFLLRNGLLEFALSGPTDADLLTRFLEAPLPDEVILDLQCFLEFVRWPMAVRSSSLLEDSQSLPLGGVYKTLMLPNSHPNDGERLSQLMQAVKRVYASTFSEHARAQMRATPYRLEEEKMAVVLQKVVGTRHASRYYPDFSGVARSYNFYPAAGQQAEDGVAAVALGLGRAVVEGEPCLSFNPRHPRQILSFSSVEDVLANSQREFWALELEHGTEAMESEEAMQERRYGLAAAEEDGPLTHVGSTYSAENHAVYDGLSRAGVRLVTFAPILKRSFFPLADILRLLLDISKQGMHREVEIEFAVRLAGAPGDDHEFGFLQVRPVARAHDLDGPSLDDAPDDQLVCRSPRVLGNGVVADLYDVVVVDFHRFDRSQTHAAAREIGRFNALLIDDQRPYLLIGVGRWGSNDPWLGIPVTWDEISGARVIVESGFRDFRVTPSQGSHFFQNLTSFGVGYFTVNADAGEGFVDWDWIAAQKAEGEQTLVRHLRFAEPLVVRMAGREGRGVILKPGTPP